MTPAEAVLISLYGNYLYFYIIEDTKKTFLQLHVFFKHWANAVAFDHSLTTTNPDLFYKFTALNKFTDQPGNLHSFNYKL
ncbi:hypothetical protein BpHYR1_042309 [Brachionus plicatilis]|uniref:Uncharacterized protein n=1 Tax=Brachionus plicatilis TaxID=10195 RepID=A0A3M7TAN9_BRAPC|nr:hypothetical protein BpHYR1_042309 [Brachionus plicatilis]